MRVARYIDQTNIIEFFEEPVRPEPTNLTSTSSSIVRLHIGRMNATSYFFKNNEIKKNRKLWDTVKSLSDYYRSCLSHSLMIEALREQIREAEQKAVEMRQSLEDQTSKVALTYTTLENPAFRPDMIINGADNNPKMREAIVLNCKLVKYIFCTDTILDCNDPDIKNITDQSLELKVGQAEMGNMHSRPQMTKAAPNPKQTPSSKMDAERRMD